MAAWGLDKKSTDELFAAKADCLANTRVCIN